MNFSNVVPQDRAPTRDDTPTGFRFVTNVATVDIDRALRAARLASPAGDIRLVLIACSDLGLPLKGAALYVRHHFANLDFFWHMYRSLASVTKPSRALPEPFTRSI